MVSKLIQETQIKHLADVPEFIPIIAQWTYDAWSQYDPTLSIDSAIGSLMARLNRYKVPMVLVAMYNENPIATVSLKSKIEITGYEDRDLWLGSFWVEPDYRDQGMGIYMLECAYKQAKDLGYAKLSLFASDLEVASWYSRHGWRKFAVAPHHGRQVTLLEHVL